MLAEFVGVLAKLVQVATVSHSATKNLTFVGSVILLLRSAIFAPSFQHACKVPFWMPAVHAYLSRTLVVWPVSAVTKSLVYMDARSLMHAEFVEETTVLASIALVFQTAKQS